MKRKLIILLISVVPFSIYSQTTSYSSYLSDFIDCLSNLNESNLIFSKVEIDSENPFIGLVYAVDKQIELVDKCFPLVKPYIFSTDTLVKSTSETTFNILTEIKNISKTQKDILIQCSRKNISSKECLKRINSQQDQIKNQYMILFFNSALYAHAIVSPKPDEKGYLSYLRLSYTDRYKLMKKLENIFGQEIKNGVKEGMSYLNGCGANLYEILSGDHLSRE